jgi:WavE lipopolysaccharide synthesis
MFEKVDSSDISIVIQGPLYRKGKSEAHKGILQSLPSLRENFPDAEIILSTWEGEDISGIKADKIVISKLPEAFPDINKSVRNFNRQLLSTNRGLEQATRKYILKTRTDLIFTSANFCEISSKKEGSIFLKPLTMPSMVFRNHTKIPFLFHPSDVVQFGLREDVLDFWNVPPEIKSEVTTSGRNNIFFRYSSTCFKYHPEQSLCIRWLKNHGINISLNSPTDLTFNLLKTWESVLVKNFHIVDFDKTGIIFPPHFYNSAYGPDTLLTDDDISEIEGFYVAKDKSLSLRYKSLWLNKYVFGFRRKTFILALIANFLYVFCPSLNQKAFEIYRKIRPR